MIINSSEILYGQEDASSSPPIALTLTPGGDLTGTVKTRVVRRPLAFNLNLSGQLGGRRRKATSINLGVKSSGDLRGSVRLGLVEPASILNQLAETAFAHQCYAARLLGDNVEIPIRSATIDKPKDEIGARVSANISKMDLSMLAPGKLYKFQIGVSAKPHDPLQWHTIIEDAPLDSRSFSRAFNLNAPSDSLTFGAFAPTADRLNKYPSANQIFYDPSKTEVAQPEATYDNLGNALTPQLVPVNGLNLYYLLNLIKQRCGFSAVETNCPNYEIARFDFSIAQSYCQTINPFLGVFKPLMRPIGDALWIINTKAEIPGEFVPRTLTAANVENLTVSIASGSRLDAIDISYIDSNTAANFYTTRTKQSQEESGTYGDADFTRTEITQTWRDWKNTTNPLVVLRSELMREVRSTYDNSLNLVGRETESFVFDSQGKQKSSTRSIESLVPNLQAGGTRQLLTTREEIQNIYYAPDPKNSRRFFQSRIVTQIRGLIAVDSENKYLDEDFKQDFLEAHKAGNLTLSMTSEFGAIKTVTDSLQPLENGQYQTKTRTVDHVRGTATNSYSEPKTGDATLSAVGGKSSNLTVWRSGLSAINRDGFPIESFAAGEVPLQFVLPIVERILDERDSGFQEGSATIIGYDPSLDRGTFFNLHDRDGASLGRFITTGLRINLENLGVPGQQKVTTEVSCSQV